MKSNFWTYEASKTPCFEDLPSGVFSGTESEWNMLSPGYKREILRSHEKSHKKIE